MQYSIVNYIKLNKSIRIDSEYFLPEYILIEKLLKNKKTSLFKNYCDFIKKGIFDISPERYKNIGYPLIRTFDIKDPLIDFSSTVFLDEKTQNEFSNSELKSGDLVFTKIGAYIGDIAYLPHTFEKYNFSQNVTGAKIKQDKISSEYLLCYFLSKYGKKQIYRAAMLSGQGKLELEDIRNFLIVDLSKVFQSICKKIVLRSYYLIDQSKSLYSQAEQLLLSELGLSDWKPKHELSFVKNFSATQQAERIDAEYFQPKYDEIIEAVKKYKGGFDKLGNLVKIKKSIEPGSEAYQKNGIPFVRVSNVSKFELSDNNQQFISEKLYTELKNHQPRKGEILLSKDATPGIAYYLNEEPKQMIISGGILRLKIESQQVLPEYLTLVLNSVIAQKQIERDVGGSVINHWRPDQIELTVIPILENAKQKEIEELIEKSFVSRKLSKSLLEIAKQGVEMAIEKTEEEAESWINLEIKNLKLSDIF
ncbi:MAG: restriction endonuclease subunit S domain-containing protein [bacterium]